MTEFAFRSLASDAEISPWLDHVVECFADKGTPRSYFERHWAMDPFRSLKGIRIATEQSTLSAAALPLTNGVIASSVRIYDRRVSLHGRVLGVGGIGEVSTKKAFRGKGLASALMNDALEYMKREGIPLAALHTSNPLTVAFYAKLGWISVPLYFYELSIDRQLLASAPKTQFDICAVPIANPTSNQSFDATEWHDIAQLHAHAVSTFSGSFVRLKHPEASIDADNAEYWRTWIAAEALERHTTYVLALYPATSAHQPNEKQPLLAYGIFHVRIHPKTQTALLVHARDFIVRSDASTDVSVLLALANEAASLWYGSHHQEPLPTVIVKVQQGLLQTNAASFPSLVQNLESIVDPGYMYKVVDGCAVANALRRPDLAVDSLEGVAMIEQQLAALMTSGNPQQHIFLEMDAY